MDPVLLSFHAPRHALEVVGGHVVREHLGHRLRDWRRVCGARDLVYLATCQRVVWMLWEGHPDGLGLDPSVLRLEGAEAWTHLLRLATGLESATLGDRDILNQFQGALDAALEAGTAGSEAEEALEDVLREAHRLRARLGLADGQSSVASVALRHLEDVLPKGARVALVGVGPMSRYLAQRLPERGFRVAVANRTRSRAEALAAELDRHRVEVEDLEALRRDPTGFHALVSATASPDPLFTRERWDGVAHPGLLALDLALPPDLDANLDALPWVTRLGLHAILLETEAAKTRRAEAAREAAAWIPESVQRLSERARERAHKRELQGAQARVNAAFDALARQAAPDGDDPVEELLRRGRTLAHRALVQGESPGTHLSRVAEILQLEET